MVKSVNEELNNNNNNKRWPSNCVACHHSFTPNKQNSKPKLKKEKNITGIEQAQTRRENHCDSNIFVSFVMIVCLILIFFPFCSSLSMALTKPAVLLQFHNRIPLSSIEVFVQIREEKTALFIILNWLVIFWCSFIEPYDWRLDKTTTPNNDE